MKGHVDSSGFPLQIAVANAINDSVADHGWSRRYSEHSWRNQGTSDTGFIDLVIANQYKTQFMVIECKRVKDTSWIFLINGTARQKRRHAKCFVFSKDDTNTKRFEWLDLTLEPSTYQSEFCVIPGTGGQSQSLIERTSAELVASTEGLAFEDKSLSLSDRHDLRIYFNVIVTTAQLYVSHMDPQSISLKDGTVKNAEFEEVPFIRFRKQLNPVYELPEMYSNFSDHEISMAKENTIFVVNSQNIVEFLKEFELDGGHNNSQYLR